MCSYAKVDKKEIIWYILNMINKNYKIVLTESDLNELKEHINKFDYLAFDTETTGLNVRKDQVIGFSLCGKAGISYYLPIKTWSVETSSLIQVWDINRINEILDLLSLKELIMWNGSYDIRITKNDLGYDFTNNLIADGMLMKHTLEEDGVFGLKPTAIENQHLLGLNVEEEANKEQIELKENIKKNGGSTTKTNYEMYKADLEVMGKYACADADLTFRLAELYRERLENEGLEEFFYDEEVMPLYKEVTIPMEENGVKLDLPLLENTRKEIEKDIKLLESQIVTQLFDDTRVQEWFKYTLDKKFPPKKTGKFGQKVAEIYFPDLPKTKSGKYSLTEKNIKSNCRPCIQSGFLLGNSELRKEDIEKVQQELFKDTEEPKINISSKKQMGEVVFDYIKIKPLTTTDKGNAQFNDSMVQHLETEYNLEWAKLLGDYNKLNKIKSAYVDRFLDNHENGYYYFSYKQHGTISGRYASDAQQLPRPKEEGELNPLVLKYNNRVREFFISDTDRVFIDADYESLEPHVFSHISNDEGLRDIFRKGHDFYSTIAIKTEKLKDVSADKKADNYLGKINKPLRQKAKAYSLGIPYGLGAFALGKTLGVEQKEAEKLIDGYLNGFPNLKKWMQDSNTKAKINGFIKSEAGRIRHLPKVKELNKKYKDKLLDFKFRKSLETKITKEEVLSIYRDYKNGLNNAKNFQIQSMSASIVNRAAIAVSRQFKELGIPGKVVANIHDQIIFDIPVDRVDECFLIVKDCMESTTKLSVELKAPPAIAKNWKEGH